MMEGKLTKLLIASNVALIALILGVGAFALIGVRGASTAALSGYDKFAEEASIPPPPAAVAPGSPAMEAKMGAPGRRAAMKKEAAANRALLGAFGGIGGLGARGTGMGGGGIASIGAMDSALAGAGGIKLADEGGRGVTAERPAQRTRAWFPETFLFHPRLVTDANGEASLSVPVPDRLTTWRVLALAHSREGTQAGSTTSFLGTLDTYVDPVVPARLHAGDEVRLPVQLVNTTDSAVSKSITIKAAGARLSGAATSARIDAHSSTVTWVTLRTDEPGTAMLEATLAGADKVVREIPVVPTGRPFAERRTGTLSAEREISLELPADLDPKSARARLVVYPGALSLVRSELAASTLRGGVADDAYALRLAGDAGKLLSALGDDPDPERLRTQSLVATQRVLRHARSNDATTAALLLDGALAHPGSPVLERLASRLVQTVVAAQRPDGTCGGGGGWTLQRVLAATADCVRIVKSAAVDDEGRRRSAAVSLKASGAVERHLALVADAYTAAALVASGAAQGGVVEVLRAKIRDAAQANADGSRSIALEAGTVRADGTVPAQAEADALAILALDPAADATLRADLGASLLARYGPASGWGDGRTNLAALRATVELFKGGLPESVKVELLLDGRPLADGVLPGKAKDALVLDVAAPGSSGSHGWSVRATPALPGLAYALEVSGYTPWRTERMQGGLELALTVPKSLAVGAPAQVSVEAAAPSGHPLTLRHTLPAGVQPDRASIEKLVEEGLIESFEIADGALTLELPARDVGETFRASYRVIPTLAGTLHAGASSLALAGAAGAVHHVPPEVWVVR